MATVKTYKELIVWQKSMDLVEQVYTLTKSFPESEKFTLTNQLRRCAVSIPSNIAEGWGRGTAKFYVHFLQIAKGSLAELETQLEIANRLKYIDQSEVIFKQSVETHKMLNGLINKIKTKIKDNGTVSESLITYN